MALGEGEGEGEREGKALALAEPQGGGKAEGVGAAQALVVGTDEAQAVAVPVSEPPAWLALGEDVLEALRETRALAQCVGEVELVTEGERLRVGVPALLREPVKEPVRLWHRESVALGERKGEGCAVCELVTLGLGKEEAMALGEQKVKCESLGMGMPLREPVALGKRVSECKALVVAVTQGEGGPEPEQEGLLRGCCRRWPRRSGCQRGRRWWRGCAWIRRCQ